MAQRKKEKETEVARRKKPKCLAPGCQREAKVRGLCTSCYVTATCKINAGETTWEQLMAAGLALERANANPIGLAIAALPQTETQAKP